MKKYGGLAYPVESWQRAAQRGRVLGDEYAVWHEEEAPLGST